MFGEIKKHAFPALALLLTLTVATGAAYPLLFTAAAQALFPRQAAGSILVKDGRVVGAELIGQPFRDPAHFWGRPSATSGHPYNAAASGGSNLGPTNPALEKQMHARADALRQAHGEGPVPVELTTASASGLDPHISPAAARYQAERVARAAGLPAETVQDLIGRHTEPRQFGFLGEPRVNVLKLNLALDDLRRPPDR